MPNRSPSTDLLIIAANRRRPRSLTEYRRGYSHFLNAAYVFAPHSAVETDNSEELR